LGPTCNTCRLPSLCPPPFLGSGSERISPIEFPLALISFYVPPSFFSSRKTCPLLTSPFSLTLFCFPFLRFVALVEHFLFDVGFFSILLPSPFIVKSSRELFVWMPSLEHILLVLPSDEGPSTLLGVSLFHPLPEFSWGFGNSFLLSFIPSDLCFSLSENTLSSPRCCCCFFRLFLLTFPTILC